MPDSTPSARRLRPVDDGTTITWDSATRAFLRRDIAPGSARVYEMALRCVGGELGAGRTLQEIGAFELVAAVESAYPNVAAPTWNRVVATLRSFYTYAERLGWVSAAPLIGPLERRREIVDNHRRLDDADLQRLLGRRADVALRERALWCLLFETAGRAEEVLACDISDLDLAKRRLRVRSKGGDLDVLHFATRSVRLLPQLIGGRESGPLFLSTRPVHPRRAPALADIDAKTGYARLSYRRAAELFKEASSGSTLHQLRHSAIAGLADDGVPLPLLMAKSRHQSLRSLQRYARPDVEAVARLTAAHDPAPPTLGESAAVTVGERARLGRHDRPMSGRPQITSGEQSSHRRRPRVCASPRVIVDGSLSR